MESRPLYYHYCSVTTFIEILRSKVLWLADLTESNDTQEVKRTFEILWDDVKARLRDSDLEDSIVDSEIEILDKQFLLETRIDKPFGICFCKYSDVLQQWLEYEGIKRKVWYWDSI